MTFQALHVSVYGLPLPSPLVALKELAWSRPGASGYRGRFQRLKFPDPPPLRRVIASIVPGVLYGARTSPSFMDGSCTPSI